MMAYYTLEQQKRAQEAIQLHQALSHPSDKALGAALRSTSYINLGLTPVDLSNARAIYGPCPHCLEGKPVPHTGSHDTFDPGGEPQKPGELLHVDIIYIDGRPRLFSVDHVTGYISLIIMASKTSENVKKAYEQLLNAYKGNLKVVRMISSDHETTLKSCESFLGEKGVKIALRIPYEHEKIAERSVRMVREKMEVKRRELPYELPPELFDALAVEVARCCNAMPNAKTIPYTPSELVTDTKFNYLTDVQVPFGMPVLVNAAQKNYTGSEPAQEIGICLGSASNTKGGIWVYIPGRQQALVRRGLQPMPMTKDIIDFMNDWARRKPAKDGEPMIVFDEKPIYSENESERIKSEIDIKLERKSVNDFNVFDRLPDEDTTENPVIEGADLEITDELMLDEEDHSSPSKRKRDEDNSNIISTKTTRRESMVPSPSFSLSPSAGASSRRQSLDNNVELPPMSLESKLEAAAEYNSHLDGGLRRSSRSNAGVPAKKYTLTIQGMLFMASYLKEWGENEQEKEAHVFATAGTLPMKQALRSDYAKEAEEAACKELLQLVKMKSWKYLRSHRDANHSVHTKETPCSMFLKPKHNSKGNFLLWKARLVGGGHRTDPNVYEPMEKHSPTVPIEVAMLQLASAIKERGNVETFDIPCAYLNAKLHKDKQQIMRFGKDIADLLVKVDPEAKRFRQTDGTILVQVQRALYGFPESAKLWYEYLSATLKNAGYTVSPSEPCLFKKINNKTRMWSFISIYVDDCLHTYNSEPMRRELYAKMKDANLPTPVVQQLNLANDISYLGMNIAMKGPDRLIISQPGYVKEILKEYKPRRGYPTPCTEDIFKRPVEELSGESVEVTDYLSKLMKLMFLATRTRPDLLLTLSVLSTKARGPNIHDMERLDRVVGYLKETEDKGLMLNIKDMRLNAYFDASWACHNDLKGHTGIIITLGHNGFPLICKSKKQKVVSRSSTEAELIAVFEGLDFLLYIRRLHEFFGYLSDEPITIYQDNTSAMTLAYLGRTASGSNSKYMDLKYFWIKEYLESKMFKLEYLPTDAMIADLFASPRIGSFFRTMRDIVLGNGT